MVGGILGLDGNWRFESVLSRLELDCSCECDCGSGGRGVKVGVEGSSNTAGRDASLVEGWWNGHDAPFRHP